RLVDVDRRVRGEGHPDTIHWMRDLARSYEGQGQLARAERLWVEVLEIRRRAYGEEHPDTLRSMHNLAVFYRDQGELSKAEPLFVKVLEVGRRAHGETHPDMLTAARNLAELYTLDGKPDRSIALLGDAWPEVRKQPGLPVNHFVSIPSALGEAYEQ